MNPSCRTCFCRLSISSSASSQVSLSSFTTSTYDAMKCIAAARTTQGVSLRRCRSTTSCTSVLQKSTKYSLDTPRFARTDASKNDHAKLCGAGSANWLMRSSCGRKGSTLSRSIPYITNSRHTLRTPSSTAFSSQECVDTALDPSKKSSHCFSWGRSDEWKRCVAFPRECRTSASSRERKCSEEQKAVCAWQSKKNRRSEVEECIGSTGCGRSGETGRMDGSRRVAASCSREA